MRSKLKSADELIDLVVQHGLEQFLNFTHSLVGLLDPQGSVICSNPAFDACRQTLPNAVAFREFLPLSTQTEFDRLFQAARGSLSPVQVQLDFLIEGPYSRCDCLFVPLGDGRMLFFAEPVFAMTNLALNQRQLEAELKEARRALANKKTELQAVLAQAKEVADTDALTFLPNRKRIIADLQKWVTYSDRYGTPLTISMIDLDHFKVVNDTYGHFVGDEVLKLIALQLRADIREPDLIGRYGGEEFLVVLPHTSISDACEQATRLCQHVRSRPIVAHQHAIHMTVSIGLAQYKIHEEKWQTLLNRADQALYQAKHNGRDQWVVIQAQASG